jgi:cytochrome P450
MTQAEELYWDPFDWKLHEDSHPVWRRMREEAPLYRNDQYDFWALTRFDDVLRVLVDWKTYSSHRGPVLETIMMGDSLNEYVKHSVICENPPVHDLHRQLLIRAFTPRAVKHIESRVREFAQKILDERVDPHGFDFVDDYGGRVPGMVIAAMLGTPDSDLNEIRHLAEEQISLSDGSTDKAHFDEVTNKLGEYFMGHVQARRKNPTEDIMSALVTMDFTDEHGETRKLTDLEACGYIQLLSAAGNDTTQRFTGWAGACLAQYPDQRAKLVANPGLIPNAVDEILRYESPSMALARVVMTDVIWYDQMVPEGSTMVIIQASTGRDQRQFENPDVLDVERKIDRHLSFGFGVHVCMGAPLARMQGRIVIEEMLKRFPEWEVEWDKTQIVHTGSNIRGYKRLPITIP